MNVGGLARILEHRSLFCSRTFVVEDFALLSSRPQTGGGPYVVEEVFPLRGSSAFHRANDGLE